jgi:hypothetical protein
VSEIVAAIASAAGMALVAAAATDLWGTARGRFSRLLGRDEPDRQDQIDGWLDATEVAVDPASAPGRNVVERQAQTWAVRLADHLERHPNSAAEMEELITRLRRAMPEEGVHISTGSVDQRDIGGSAVANTGIIAGDVNIDRRRSR